MLAQSQQVVPVLLEGCLSRAVQISSIEQVNYLEMDRVLHRSKSKAIADNTLNLSEIVLIIFECNENCGKRKNC